MTNILLSIQPIHVCNILNLLKKYEVRKHAFKTGDVIWVYCTKFPYNYKRYEFSKGNGFINDGKVVAKFVVGEVHKIEVDSEQHNYWANNGTCMTVDDFISYCNGKDLFAHEITQLEIFDKPKGLNEFYHKCKYEIDVESSVCAYCDKPICHKFKDNHCLLPLTHAPQSFVYIEVLNAD